MSADDSRNPDSRKRVLEDNTLSRKKILEDYSERRTTPGTVHDRRKEDGGGDDANNRFERLVRRVEDVEYIVVSIISSMPNKRIEDHEDYHQKQLEALANKAKLEEAAMKVRNELIADLVKFAVKATAAVVLGIFALGLSTKFDGLVNKVIDAKQAQVGVEK